MSLALLRLADFGLRRKEVTKTETHPKPKPIRPLWEARFGRGNGRTKRPSLNPRFQFSLRENAISFPHPSGHLGVAAREYERFGSITSVISGPQVVHHSRFGLGAILDEWGVWVDVDDRGNELVINGVDIYEVKFNNGEVRSINGCWLAHGSRAVSSGAKPVWQLTS